MGGGFSHKFYCIEPRALFDHMDCELGCLSSASSGTFRQCFSAKCAPESGRRFTSLDHHQALSLSDLTSLVHRVGMMSASGFHRCGWNIARCIAFVIPSSLREQGWVAGGGGHYWSS